MNVPTLGRTEIKRSLLKPLFWCTLFAIPLFSFVANQILEYSEGGSTQVSFEDWSVVIFCLIILLADIRNIVHTCRNGRCGLMLSPQGFWLSEGGFKNEVPWSAVSSMREDAMAECMHIELKDKTMHGESVGYFTNSSLDISYIELKMQFHKYISEYNPTAKVDVLLLDDVRIFPRKQKKSYK